MKGLWLVTLAVLIGAMGLAGLAVAETPDGCSQTGLNDNFGPSGQYYHVGDTICYEITFKVDPDACDIEDAVVTFWSPAAYASVDPDNICGSPGGSVLDPALYIPQTPAGDPPIVFDCGGYAALDYTVNAADVVMFGGFPAVLAHFCIDGDQLVGPPPLPEQDEKASINWVLAPCIEVTKEVCEYSKIGDTITYRICVKNCSDESVTGGPAIPTTLYNVVVSDPLLGGVLDEFPDELAPGQEVCLDFTYTVLVDDPSPLENTVTASGEDISEFMVQDTDTASVTLVDPSIEVTVECMTPQSPGGVSEFLVTIDNTGDVDLAISSNKPGDVAGFELAAGGTETFTVSADCTPPEVCYDIEVFWSIPTRFCDLPNTGMVFAEDCCQCCEPCIEIRKSVDCDISKVGDDVIYTIEIKNCGDVELTDVVVTDPHLSASPLAGFPSPLPADDMWYSVDFTYTVEPGDDTGADYPGAVMENQAHVEAIGLCGDVPETFMDDSEIVEVALIHPSFTVDKVCVEDPLPSGATEAWYTVTIANTGDVALDITTDDGIGPLTIADGDAYSEDVSEDIPVGVGSVCNKIVVTATIPSEFCDLQNVYVDSAEACCELEGAYGCTPGFWKNQTECWECYTTSTLLCDVFTFPAGDLYNFFCTDGFTLHKALKFGGGEGVVGKARNLMRHGVAALLNACDADVPYGMGPAGVIEMVNDALATEDEDEITSVKNQLAAWNERGCSQDAHCNPIDPEDMEIGGTIGMMGDDLSATTELPTEHLLQSELAVPREFSVRGYPNPAGTSASIRYAIPMDSKVTVEILDVQGRLVTKLLDQHMPAGSHTVAWSGDSAPAGVYFCKVQCCDGKETISKVIKVQ